MADSVETIAIFGSWSHEPFVLLWSLDACDVWVVELEKRNVLKLRDELEILLKKIPNAFKGRCVKFISGDMVSARLPHEYFDMAYCERVLCNLSTALEFDFDLIRAAITTMAQVVNPNGWVVAVEPPLADQHEETTREIFSAAGLIRADIGNSPYGAFTYKKSP